MKGFVIASPWIDLILSGEKTWELRSTYCRYRGPVALIRKGSGTVVATARFQESNGPLSDHELLVTYKKHQVPEEVWRSGSWRLAWVLADVCPLRKPVPYVHRKGAQSWVTLDVRAIEAIEHASAAEPEQFTLAEAGRANTREGQKVMKITTTTDYRCIVVIETPGGIDNKYLKLGKQFDWFPSDAVGGKSRREQARRTIRLHWGGPAPTISDIDGKKKFIRNRQWFPAFVKLHDLQVGDAVQFSRVGDYEYAASPIKAAILKSGRY